MNEWIPVKIRPMTEEEKAEYNCNDDVKIFDCPLPENGQDVLVTTRYGDVQMDTFFTDEGSYFERYCDDGDVLAWMPLPEPYLPDIYVGNMSEIQTISEGSEKE